MLPRWGAVLLALLPRARWGAVLLALLPRGRGAAGAAAALPRRQGADRPRMCHRVARGPQSGRRSPGMSERGCTCGSAGPSRTMEIPVTATSTASALEGV